MSDIPNLADIRDAHERIKPFIHRTPVLSNANINRISGASLYFKCENLQRIGAFKIRGATNAILQLSPKQLRAGVITHSSGNHAQAVALAAREVGAEAYIVMPKNAPQVKVDAVIGYGAHITFCEPTLEAREYEANKIIAKKKATFIHPFDNKQVISGQATAAVELMEQTKDLDFIVAPVGGGGLLSGTALACSYIATDTKVIAGEPLGANDAFESMKQNRLLPAMNPKSIADGLLTSLSNRTFEVIKTHVDEVVTVSDEEIIKAMQLMMERMKLVVEPSGAISLAAVLKRPDIFQGRRAGIVISGGNVDLSALPF